MRNSKKFSGKRKEKRKGSGNKDKRKGFKKTINKKKKEKDTEFVNKKAIFNRYRNKQKVEEELKKKKQLEQKLEMKQMWYPESEEEEDPYTQLMATFGVDLNKKPKVIETDESSCSSDSPSADAKVMDIDNADCESNEEDEKSDEEDEKSDEEDEINEEEEAIVEVDEQEQDLDNEDNDDDPFVKHLHYDIGEELFFTLSNTPLNEEEFTETWPVLGNLKIFIPKPIASVKKPKPKVTLIEETIPAPLGTVPRRISDVNFNELHIKPQIQRNIVSANTKNLITRDLELTDVFTDLQKELFSIMNNYQDLYYTERSFSNADEIRYMYCLHVVNHTLKSRIKVLHHNAKMRKNHDILSDEFRDQGLVRPKVLILAPFKDSAYRIVKTLKDILVPKEVGQVINYKRFEDEFTGCELKMPKKKPKPEDYQLMFSGNTDDSFRVGMSVTKKTLKLYTDFYASDILVASPLGLRMIIGAEGEEERDYDFLASIEILIIDQADVIYMQNWEHLLHVLKHMHLQPTKMRDSNFFRARSWAVNGWAKYYRQTLTFTSMFMPIVLPMMRLHCRNYAGRAIVLNTIQHGTIEQVFVQVPQIFYRFNASTPVSAVDARFDYFIKEMLPRQMDSMFSHTMIYVPCYYEYVRIRNHFKKESISFVQICEYSKEEKIARARDMFFHTEAHFLLYCGRAHFFHRYRVKGIRHIIFYQPPEYPHFYTEMCNLMHKDNQNKYGGSPLLMSVSVLYCHYDAWPLGRIVGTNRAMEMINADNSMYKFSTQ